MTTAAPPNPELALRYCREVTRRRARNFYYGLKLLPEPQRSALYAVYAWMRRADDLVDETGIDPQEAHRRIEDLRRSTVEALAGRARSDDYVLVGLKEVQSRFDVPIEHFHEMLDGQLDDLTGRTYQTFDELREYCRRVASSVGIICISIWGYDDDRAPELAVDRGIALQLTNILRDFAEDHDAGRVYLPAEDFHRHELETSALRRWRDPQRCGVFLRKQIDRAESFYVRSAPLDELINPTCRPTLWAMTTIYHRLLGKISRRPARLMSGRRVSLSPLEKCVIVLQARRRGRVVRKMKE
ncbi:MAG: phytoene/squalene synthase family protein [Phycisphaerales bacterium]|nr:MAG: phytoene/squalene synthase family protein [Phycisphaerales bacterium]